MKTFDVIRSVLEEIQATDRLVAFKNANGGSLLLLHHVSNRGEEQPVLEKVLDKRDDMSEQFYGYLSWIVGEAMNNVFDHGQTLGQTLKGGLLGLDIKDSTVELVVGDLGIGLLASLSKNPDLQASNLNPKKAIVLALSENISGWPQKRGNGLPDIMRLSDAGAGTLQLYSDGLLLTHTEEADNWSTSGENLPGVIVGVELPINDFEVPRRSVPKGRVIKMFDQFGKQLSGRDRGQEAYELLVRELTELPKDGTLLLDFSAVVMMNTSFGDQSIGVLLESIEQGHYGSKQVYITGKVNNVVRLCLDRLREIRKVEVKIV